MFKKAIIFTLALSLMCAFPAGAFAEGVQQAEQPNQEQTMENIQTEDQQDELQESIQNESQDITQNEEETGTFVPYVESEPSGSADTQQAVEPETPQEIKVTYMDKTLWAKHKLMISKPSGLSTPITKWTTSNSTVASVTNSGMATAKKLRAGTLKGYNDAGQLCMQVKVKVVLGKDYTLFVAHRGLSRTAPENTLPAFREAVKAGFGGIELDVWESRTTKKTSTPLIIVMHDSNLKSKTGKNKKTQNLNWTNRKNYKVKKNVYGLKKYGAQPIPNLYEALNCIYKEADKQGTKDFVVEIDVKNKLSDKAVKYIVSIVGKHRVHILSANVDTLKKFKKYRKYSTTEVWCCTGSNNASTRNKKIESAGKNHFDGMSLPKRNVTVATIKKVHSYGMQMGMYDVSTAADVQKWTDLGSVRFNMYTKVFTTN